MLKCSRAHIAWFSSSLVRFRIERRTYTATTRRSHSDMQNPRFIDIGSNLLDPQYAGFYHGSATPKHKGDLARVLLRARQSGVEKIILTCGSLGDSLRAQELLRGNTAEERSSDALGASDLDLDSPPLPAFGPLDEADRAMLSSTVGVHPTRVLEFVRKAGQSEHDQHQDIDIDSESAVASARAHIAALKAAVASGGNGVVAIGELGLDYDRLKFAPREAQRRFFELQLVELSSAKLPMFFHMRNAADDFIDIVKRHRSLFEQGVVHSFDGTLEEARRILDLDLFIGINGCSLKGAGNIEVIRQLPLDRIMLETDAPWCDVRPSHSGSSRVSPATAASFAPAVDRKKWTPDTRVKGRNEPCTIAAVADVVASVQEISVGELAAAVLTNTNNVFFGNRD